MDLCPPVRGLDLAQDPDAGPLERRDRAKEAGRIVVHDKGGVGAPFEKTPAGFRTGDPVDLHLEGEKAARQEGKVGPDLPGGKQAPGGDSPETFSPAAGTHQGRVDPFQVADIGGKRERHRKPFLHQFFVNQDGTVRPVDPDEGKEPAKTVPRLDVGFKADAFPQDEVAVCEGSFQPELFDFPLRMMQFGSVDQEVAHLFGTPAVQQDLDRVPVENGHDGSADRFAPGGFGSQHGGREKDQK